MNKTIKKNIAEEAKGKSLARLTKDFNREVKTKRKLEKQIKKQKGEEKAETQIYVETLREKLLLLLEAITPEKVKGSNLASISKAYRSILGQLAELPEKEKEPNKNINLNINIDNLSPEEMIERLNKISSGQQDE